MKNHRYALITGGSRGIGKAICSKLAQENFHVAFTYNTSEKKALTTLSELKKLSNNNHFCFKADASNPEQITKISLKIKNEFGGLNLLVNNAGWTEFIDHKNLNELTIDIFDKIYKVNLRGCFLTIKELEELLKNKKNSLIVNIASIASVSAMGSNIAYCAMKAGLVNMTQSLARSLAPDIRVNSISPALTDTDLTKDWDKYRQQQILKTPLKRLGSCDDIADTVWSLYDQMKFVTGQNIIVDGGRLLN